MAEHSRQMPVRLRDRIHAFDSPVEIHTLVIKCLGKVSGPSRLRFVASLDLGFCFGAWVTALRRWRAESIDLSGQ